MLRNTFCVGIYTHANFQYLLAVEVQSSTEIVMVRLDQGLVAEDVVLGMTSRLSSRSPAKKQRYIFSKDTFL